MSFTAIFVWPWKMVSVSVRYLYYQPMDEKIKTGTLGFPAKENPNMERALFDWPMVLQYDVKLKYRLISRKFFGREVFSTERSRNQPKATRVRFRSTNQSNRSISVRLFFLFCSRLFIARSHENRSICIRINNHFHLQGSKTSWILSCALDKQLSYFTFPGHFLLVLVTYTAFVRGWLAWNLAQWASKR